MSIHRELKLPDTTPQDVMLFLGDLLAGWDLPKKHIQRFGDGRLTIRVFCDEWHDIGTGEVVTTIERGVMMREVEAFFAVAWRVSGGDVLLLVNYPQGSARVCDGIIANVKRVFALADDKPGDVDKITARRSEVRKLNAQGLTIGQIAVRVGRKESTIKRDLDLMGLTKKRR